MEDPLGDDSSVEALEAADLVEKRGVVELGSAEDAVGESSLNLWGRWSWTRHMKEREMAGRNYVLETLRGCLIAP